ncbi:hypothetical protein [Conexibacter sp. CPCC 206217]|uniref:hypothetical protein n=1 Tax=Conexibacter sp. CPCC 206217 TaxID=3064574 RepID=UPI0027274779|nr:hypothetical protein [Conexibacter sp. CPCC 206217]MDO8213867.1 hypothetical protein [Conexibacter sp. CPCC 206217]
MLTAALLAVTAFTAGVTGAWSPCGFSMVETLAGAAGREGAERRRLVRTSCTTFALGALLGGALTFGLLSVLGAALGAGGSGTSAAIGHAGSGTGGRGQSIALVVAAIVALAAALADAFGVRVAPQIRRQVPERWRRTLPLPLAAALYGVLLGLGFTTFVLVFAVWALAGISVALGDPASGVAIGLAFGVGRALPVVAMAPRFDTLGIRLAERMANEPRLLRRLRRADAVLLAAAALALLLGPAAASADATLVARDATDPSQSGGAVAWRQVGGRSGMLQTPESPPSRLLTPQLAIGGAKLALVRGDAIVVRTLHAPVREIARVPAARVTGLAVSRRWVAWRTTRDGGDELRARSLARSAHAATATTGRGSAHPAAAASARLAPPTIVATRRGATLGRPALAGDRLTYAVSTARGSSIVVRDLVRGRSRTVLRSRRTELSQPSLNGDALLYAQARACDQRLLLRRPGSATRTLLWIGSTARRDEGHDHHHTNHGSEPGACPPGTPHRTQTVLWSTALARHAAFVTLLRPAAGGSPGRARIVRVAR